MNRERAVVTLEDMRRHIADEVRIRQIIAMLRVYNRQGQK